MFRKVLFPTDFSDWAERTFRHLPAIPGVEEVILLHILEPERLSIPAVFGIGTEPPREYAARRLEEECRALRTSGVRAVWHLEESSGAIGMEICRCAKKLGADLIAMGARRRGLIGSLLLGSVSSRVLSECGFNLLLMQFRVPIEPEEGRFEPLFSRVLCPLDLSRPSVEMLKGLSEARIGGEIHLLHVLQGGRNDRRGTIEEELGALARGLETPTMKVHARVEEGDPVAVILEVAEEIDATLILMARQGRSDFIRGVLLGRTTTETAKRVLRPILVMNPRVEWRVETRELRKEEFPLAERVWYHYHQQTADAARDRIFAVFVEGEPVSVARCRRHDGGGEVDGVFTLEEFRGKGFARMAVKALVDACGDQPLYMHSTLELVEFYRTFGFEPIAERELPPTIRERLAFAGGDMKAMHVQPMRRLPSQDKAIAQEVHT